MSASVRRSAARRDPTRRVTSTISAFGRRSASPSGRRGGRRMPRRSLRTRGGAASRRHGSECGVPNQGCFRRWRDWGISLAATTSGTSCQNAPPSTARSFSNVRARRSSDPCRRPFRGRQTSRPSSFRRRSERLDSLSSCWRIRRLSKTCQHTLDNALRVQRSPQTPPSRAASTACPSWMIPHHGSIAERSAKGYSRRVEPLPTSFS